MFIAGAFFCLDRIFKVDYELWLWWWRWIKNIVPLFFSFADFFVDIFNPLIFF